MPARMLHNVVLPAPFSPSRAWTSPRRNSRSTSRSAQTPSKLFETWRAQTAGTSAGTSTPAAGPSPESAVDAGYTLDGPVDQVGLLIVEALPFLQPLRALVVDDRARVGVERPVEQLGPQGVDRGADVGRHLVAPSAEIERQQ